jgi:ribosome maturation factor RimP
MSYTRVELSTLCFLRRGTLIQAIEKLIKPPIEALGLALYEVSLSVNQGERYLHVYIEKPEGRIDLQAIVQVTQTISPLLDASGLMQEHYILDVASAGAEHPIHLDELPKYLHRFIAIHLLHPFEGLNTLQGQLLKLEPHQLTLEILEKARKRTVVISRQDIDYARLAVGLK